MQCYGLEHIPQDKPYIIMPNHTSHLDTLTVITALEKKRRTASGRSLHEIIGLLPAFKVGLLGHASTRYR